MGLFKKKVMDHPKVDNRTVGSSYSFYMVDLRLAKMSTKEVQCK